MRDELRTLWRALLSPDKDWFRPGILIEWLEWRPSREESKNYVGGNYQPFFPSIPARRLVPDTSCLRPMLIQGVFEQWHLLKHCANPVCLSPYFIAKRRDQLVCNAEICKAERQREHARKWWNANRSSNVLHKPQVPTKVANNGRKNVPHKTR